jgi:transposase
MSWSPDGSPPGCERRTAEIEHNRLLGHNAIGKAASYVVANWDRLTRFVGDPRIPLDNNATERGIRGPVVGRKNHYGSESRRH